MNDTPRGKSSVAEPKTCPRDRNVPESPKSSCSIRGSIYSDSALWKPPFLGYGSKDAPILSDFTATKKGNDHAAEFPRGKARRIRPSIV